jgi:TRAP transporter 4TM/12TM fusion protein
MADSNSRQLTDEELQELVAASDTGGRAPTGALATFIAGVALTWSLFQLWIASPLQFMLGQYIPVLNSTDNRSIHLAFALFLAFMAYPALKSSPRHYVPISDWILAILGAACSLYIFVFADALADRPGLPTQTDIIVAGIGIVILLEAARRALGPALAIVALVFLSYVFFGSSPVVPDVIRWGGASFSKAMSHQWITTEGVFGIALGVSTSFVFLFVLFGSLLDKAGAGNYFIKVAFALLGHLRGGPAKAAVVGSAMTGLISGSSIANVVTTGTFTVPLMKRVGFTAEKAGAVEVASSVNGQIMPPVMGAAAFLMVEYIGISYLEVIKHAVLPASISYIALLYIVHLEALKNNLKGLPKPGEAKTWQRRLLGFITGFAVTAILCAVTYYGIGFIKTFGDAAGWVSAIVVAIIYASLVWYASKFPDLEMDDPNAEVVKLPEFAPTFKTGLHYILPIVVLVWFLMIERKSPGLSAFWASVLMIFILLTQKPLKTLFRGKSTLGKSFKEGFDDLIAGLIAGARNMIGIGVATAAAGIIVGTVTLTGIGQVMSEFVEFISGGNLMLMLIFVAIISLILGMGLPTTANYIVVSSLMAGVVVELGAQSGLIVPLIAVHLFVFYFGIMADVTPPVGLASFAAAAVSGGDPIKTGFTAFFYSLRTVALPFLFIFNTDLLLINVDFAHGVLIFVIATVAMLLFAAATQGYFMTRSRLWESAALLLIAFTLFRPGFWLDIVQPPYNSEEPANIYQVAEQKPEGAKMRIVIQGPDFLTGENQTLTVLVPLGNAPEGQQRVEQGGLNVRLEDGKAIIDEPFPGTTFFEKLQNFDFYGTEPVEILTLEVPNDRMPKEIFWLPALLLLGLVYFVQKGRASKEDKEPETPSADTATA